MKVLSPTVVTDDILVSSSIPETDYDAWSAATSYELGDRVIRTTTHKVYACLVAGVDATTPEESVLLDTPHWVEKSPTNRWAMFDSQVSTESTATSEIVIVLEPGIIDALAVVNVAATSVTVEVEAESETVYSAEKNLDLTEISDWYEYFFRGFTLSSLAVFRDIPPYASGVVTVTISGTGIVSAGAVLIGREYEIGDTRWDPVLEIVDYSKKTTDEYGTTTLVVRQWAKKGEFSLLLENNRISSVFGLMSALRATPSLWITSDDIRMEPFTIFGWYASFSITIPYPNHSLCTLQIQGLT